MTTAAATSPPPLRIQVATYNFNLQGTAPTFPSLQSWLIPTLSETRPEYSSTSMTSGRDAPDIYAVGFQELLPLHHAFADDSTAKEVRNHTAREIRRAVRHHAAVTRVDRMYPPGQGPEDYTLLAEVHLVSITLFVFGRNVARVPNRLKEARVATASTGIFNLLGNKGAAGVRLVLGGSGSGEEDQAITLVCAHLAAHDHNTLRRNADLRTIVSRLAFTPQTTLPLPLLPVEPKGMGEDLDSVKQRFTEAGTPAARKEGQQARPLDNKTYGLYDSHHAFFFGDLNYRLALEGKGKGKKEGSSSSSSLSKHDVRRKVSQQDYATLAKLDQLSRERQAGRTLQGFVEVDVGSTFGPTYKFKPIRGDKGGEAGQDGKEKATAAAAAQELSAKRVPGWTDRILWLSNGGQDKDEKTRQHGVTVELFRSIMGYTISDHKPVTLLASLPPAKQLNSKLAPVGLDGNHALYRGVGTLLDRLVGYAWCLLVTAGAGRVLVGVAEVVVVALLSVWWLRTGGEGGDVGYWFASLGARP